MGNENLLPRNIRQIGDIQGRQKICLEDYVMTYIRKMEDRGAGNYLGVFLGERKSTPDADCVFVRGIMEIPDFSLKNSEKEKADVGKKGADAGKEPLQKPEASDKENKRDGITAVNKTENAAKENGTEEQKEKKGLWQAFQKRYGMPEETGSAGDEQDTVWEKKADEVRKNMASEKPAGEAWKNTALENRADKARKNTGQENTAGTIFSQEDTKDPWETLRKEIEERFPGCGIQGCCVIGMYPAGRMEELSAHFPEAGQILYHLQDQEERLYWLDSGQYEGLSGYFVFYEQNERMQEYLAETFGETSVEKEGLPEQAIRNFREKIKNKSEERSRSFLKLASSFFVVGVLIIGVIVVNRVEDQQQMRSLTAVNDSAETSAGRNSDNSTETLTAADDGSSVEASANAGDQSSEIVLSGSDAFWADETEEVESTDSAQTVADTEAAASASASDVAEVSADESEKVAETALETILETVSETASEMVSETVAETIPEPDAETVSETVAETEEAAAVASRQVQAAYVIREGDTLASICAQYYGSLERLEELCEANGIEDANLILPGQKIVLP
ncbi:MAG: LysM peptidoglycan-binding domain-containing protein [Clostridiales bacterium]|nr:LysM peptidoglycan-binding domain-containing protein [Clostridiales bacterium]